jgi:hypothetical protein
LTNFHSLQSEKFRKYSSLEGSINRMDITQKETILGVPWNVLSIFIKEKISNLISKSNINTLKNNRGYLAGGSISNIIYHYFHPTSNLVINDIDYYIQDSSIIKHCKTIIQKLSRSYHHYDISSIEIFNIEVDGLLQKIYVKYDDSQTYLKEARILIESFDINCTQSAYEWKTGFIFVTEEFITFLKTKQIELLPTYHTLHSLLRGLKKRDELGAYFDVSKAKSLVSDEMLQPDKLKNIDKSMKRDKYIILYH